MKPSIFRITLGVADVNRSTAFYRDVLGFPMLARYEDMVFIELEGTRLAIFQREHLAEAAGVSSAGSGFSGLQLSFHADEKEHVEQILAAAQQAGGQIIRSATEIIPHEYSGVFADSDGFIWDVSWRDEAAIAEETAKAKLAARNSQSKLTD